MGSKRDELERFADESPCHKVRIGYDLALGECAVSFSEWDAYAHDGNFRPGDEGWGRDDRPIINVSWLDVKRYIDWLNSRLRLTDRPDRYRLPSEAEWEYGCRGGTDTPFWWGLEITPDQANYDGKCVYAGGGLREIYRQQTVPVRSFSPNPYGLYQVHGNVLEWCEDVWHRSYVGAPTDGSAWVVGGDQDLRILRGGSWHSHPAVLRSAFRIGSAPFSTSSIHGFRIARTLSS